MSQNSFYAGVVRKKYTLFCVASDGARIEIVSCYDKNAAEVASQASKKILLLMSESFDMDEDFQIKIEELMESADDIPLVEVQNAK